MSEAEKMLFPSRVIRVQIPQLFAQLSSESPDATVLGYAEHHDKVPPGELAKLRKLADRIVDSQFTNAPITAVQIVGHADHDLRVTGKAREESERKHSVGRADEVKALLLQLVKKLRPRSQRALDTVMFKQSGVGATHIKILNPRNEQERKINRRVEIFIGQGIRHPDDPQPPQIVPPERPDPNFEEDDPNTVLAGNKFRIKMLSEFSGGQILGFATITYLLWDIKNSRSAEYEENVAILTAGTPITKTFEGDFSDTFTTSKFIQVDQFSGTAGHAAIGGGPFGFMRLTLRASILGIEKPVSVNVPTGFSVGFGVELAESGDFSLKNGSVQVFRGP
jgi:hypothetical protein